MLARAKARMPEATPLGAVWLPLAIAAALVLAAVAAAGHRGEIVAGLAGALVVLTAPLIDRRLLVPVVILVLPLEIWEELAPFSFTSDGFADRMARSTLLNAGRVAIFALAAYWLLTARAGWERQLPTGRLVAPSFALLALFAFATIYSHDFGQGAVLTVTLGFHLVLMMLVPAFVRDRATLRLCLWALIGVMTVLAFVGIVQQATGTFLWNPDLGFENTPRVNTTFLDPNIYARMLVVAMVLAIAIAPSVRRQWRTPMVVSVLAPCALALLFTNSRSGWLVAAMALPLTIALMPMPRRMRLGAIGGAIGGAAILLLVGEVAFGATFFARAATLGDGWDALGTRRFLLEAGWHMFLDNPLAGIGLGGFQDAYRGAYSHYNLDPGSRVSLSHTEVMTVLAELGIAGAVVAGFLFVRYGQTVVELFRSARGEDRALIAGLGVAVLAIAVSAQAEARLLGDPYLWLLFGLTLAAEGILQRERAATSGDG